MRIVDKETLKVEKDGEPLGKFSYTVDSVQITIDSNNQYTLYGLKSNRTWYALGALYICGDYMLVSESSIDGPDMFYWRE